MKPITIRIRDFRLSALKMEWIARNYRGPGRMWADGRVLALFL